jgi:hypothetical protein
MKYDWVKTYRNGELRDNDEGYHWKRCSCCNKVTEHGITEGCLECSSEQHNYSANKKGCSYGDK